MSKIVLTKKKTFKKRKLNSGNQLVIHKTPVSKLRFQGKTRKHVRKFLSFDINQDVLYSAPVILCPNSTIINGNDDESRIGSQINMISFQYKGKINPKYRPTSGISSCKHIPVVNICVVYDKDPRGALPSISGSNDSIFNGANPHDMPLFRNSTRYTILSNKMYTPTNPVMYYETVAGTTSYTQMDYALDVQDYQKISLPTNFQQSTYGDIRDVSSGALYIILRSDAITGGSYDDTVRVDLDFRIRFQDA